MAQQEKNPQNTDLNPSKKQKHLSEDHKRKLSIAGQHRKHSDETRKKMSDSAKGRHWTEEQKQQFKNNPNFGMKGKKFTNKQKQNLKTSKLNSKKFLLSLKSKERREKISKSLSGKSLTKEHKKKISEKQKGLLLTTEVLNKRKQNPNSGMKNKTHLNITKIKMRNAKINNILKDGQFLSIGKNEKKILDEQEIKNKCKIERQYLFSNLGYVVDGYCRETNTVYEVYEKFHDKKIFEDLKREEEICRKLNCDFIIIWDRSH